MISASIEVKGPERDLHSGNEGGKVLRMASGLIQHQAMYGRSIRAGTVHVLCKRLVLHVWQFQPQ